MDHFEKSLLGLRKFISENKEQVTKDVEEMIERSKKSNNITVGEYIRQVSEHLDNEES